MIRTIEMLQKQKKKKKNRWVFFISLTTIIIVLSYLIYNHKEAITLQIKKIFLPESIKYAESKLTHLQLELKNEILNQNSIIENFYKNTEKRKELLKKVDENIHLLLFYESSSENLKDLYYYLTLSYFFKIILYYDFTKENLFIQISRGILPDSTLSKQTIDLQQGEIISKKLAAIDQNYESNDYYIVSYITINLFNKHILSKYLLKMINKVNANSLDPIFKPYYEWFYLTINSNYGNVEKINEFFTLNTYWKFSEEEKFFIQSTTYYYAKDYYNFFKIFYSYKNQFHQPYDHLNDLHKFIYKELLRFSVESFFLQRNFFLANIYINELNQIATKENDQFIQKRIELLLKKMK